VRQKTVQQLGTREAINRIAVMMNAVNCQPDSLQSKLLSVASSLNETATQPVRRHQKV
jgi:hypothetical protein